ncbi:MAG: NAD(P)H-dependent oxidoreductase subunit E [Thermodesulfobacteriota bacterium]|nr:NAD(P)H-dependent oxidoreductase subunit E [Thermodesulfobacteriota bacterium]
MEDTANQSNEEIQKTQEILEKNDYDSKNLVKMLQDIQAELGYVPGDSQKFLAKKLRVPVSHIFGILTFYNFFRLYPPGRHSIDVCLGTACYVKGAKNILNEIVERYGIKPGQTTPDRKFSMDIVRCVGCCAIGPVMLVDGTVYGKMKPEKVKEILRRYK